MEAVTNPEIQNLPPITPQNNNYKILFFVSLGLLLIIGSVLTTLLITQKSLLPTQTINTQETKSITSVPTESAVTPTVVTTPIESATTSSIPKDWKTYISKELSLSFKYPTSWGEPKLEVVDYDAKGGPFSGKAVWINFKKSYLSSTRNIISIIGVNKNYKNYIDIDSYIGDQENLDLSETFNQQKENVYFTKKMTVASQKTAIKTSLNYQIEGGGVLVESTTKLNGKNEYTGITVKATYSNFNQTLDKYYDAGENKGLEPAAIKILTGLKDGNSQDKDMENLYKDYQTFLSTFKFN